MWSWDRGPWLNGTKINSKTNPNIFKILSWIKVAFLDESLNKWF